MEVKELIDYIKTQRKLYFFIKIVLLFFIVLAILYSMFELIKPRYAVIKELPDGNETVIQLQN